MEFTDAEIREELARLGYRDVPDDKLLEFKKDLLKLIHSERSKTNSLNSSVEDHDHKRHDVADTHNLSGYQTQWREPTFREDWQYTGKTSRPVTAGPTVGRKNNAAKSFGLFEQPLDLDFEDLSHNHPQPETSSRYKMEDKQCNFSAPRKTETKQMKRKTAWASKYEEEPSTSNEDEASESDTAGLYELYERVRNLAMRDCECREKKMNKSEAPRKNFTPMQSPIYRIPGVNTCPSVIKVAEPPHLRNKTRTDPWKRHHLYLKAWKVQPPIGEDNRNALRNEVQARMLVKQEVVLPRKVHKPNRYVPPPDKHRYKLRWDVRRANSQYQMPCKTVCGGYFPCNEY